MSKNSRITIASIEVENFRRLTVAKLEYIPAKGLVRVTGDNAAGKTSLLKTIMGLLGGDGAVDVGSLHEGTDKGRIFARLTNGYTIERRMTEANPKGAIVVRSPEGGRFGQSKINSWLGNKSFDPMAILSLSEDRIRDVLFSIGKDPDLPEKLKDVREEHAEVYEERTPIISRQRHLAKIAIPEGERPEPVDTSEEMARLGELQRQERAKGDALRDAEAAVQSAVASGRIVGNALMEIERLEQSLKEAHAALKKDQATAKMAEKHATVAKESAESLPDPVDEIDEVRARLETASEIQATTEPWVRWDEARKELDTLADDELHLKTRLRSLKQRETDLLDNAGIPVADLSFGESGKVLLKGQSLSLASGGDRMDFAVDVAFACDQDLGVCLLDEGNDYDLESLDRLHKRAVAKEFQVLLCRIGIEGPGEIVVEDGVASVPEMVPSK